MDQRASTIANAIKGSLDVIGQEREREIIARRFGLNGQKETLEQIGELLNITRERVRQLEKAILIRLRIAAADGQITALPASEKLIIRNRAGPRRPHRPPRQANLWSRLHPRRARRAHFPRHYFLRPHRD